MSRFTRGNLMLAGLVVLLGALYFAMRPEPEGERGLGRPLFPEATAENARVLEVRGPGGRVRLERRDGDTGEAAGWRLADQHGFPAEGWAADEMLARLVRVTGAERLSDGGGEAFGLEGPQAVNVTLLGEDGRLLARFDQAPEGARRGAGTGTFLRPAGGSAVYRAPLVPRLADRPERWLPARLVSFDPVRVAGFEVHLDGERSLVFERSGDAQAGWRAREPVAANVPRVPVERLLAAAGRLVPEAVLAAEPEAKHGLEPGELRLVLRWADGSEPSHLTLASLEPGVDGAEREEGDFVATTSLLEQAWVVRLSPEGVRELLVSVQELARAVR